MARHIPLFTALVVLFAFAGCQTLPAPATQEAEFKAPFVRLTWSPIAGAVGYRLQVAYNGGITDETPLAYTTDTAEPEADLTGHIKYDRRYFYRVAAKTGPDSIAEWSPERTLFAYVGPPKPVAPSGALNGSPKPRFKWELPGFKENTYKVEVSTQSDFRTAIRRFTSSLDAAEFDTTEWKESEHFPYEQDLFWRIRTHWRGRVVGPWSAPAQFRVEYYVPDLISPVNGERIASLNPTLKWLNSPYPDAYEIALSEADRFVEGKDFTFLVKAHPEDKEQTFVFRSMNLKADRTYRWRMRSVYGDEKTGKRGKWSQPGSFVIPPDMADTYPTSLVQKTPDRHEVAPRLSPAGDEVAFHTYEKSKSDNPFNRYLDEQRAEKTIWIKRIETVDGEPQFQEAVERFTEPQPKLQTIHPAWGNDGTWICFGSNRYDFRKRTAFSILSQDRNAAAQMTIVAPTAGESFAFPHVGPEGKRIVYTVFRDNIGYLWCCNRNGTGKTSLTRGKQGSISPDGKKIVFVSDRDGNWGLYTMTARGGNVTVLHPSKSPTVRMEYPTWSRDGNHIAFASNQAGNMDIYTYDVKTQQVRQVTASLAQDTYPMWGKDDRYILFVSRRESDSFDLWYTILPEKR